MTSPPRRSPWILSPAVDLTLIVGAPLVCLALVLPLARLTSSEQVWAAVMTLAAVGHHLPGFLRTYGDRALYRRYRARFLGAPPLVMGAALVLAFRDLHALALVTLGWSLWHGLMQHYGFVRIYDAKVGSTSARAARLDWLLSASWFLVCIAWSPTEGESLLEALAASHVAPLPPSLLPLVGRAALVASVGVTVAYVVDLVAARRAGQPRSPIKLVMIALVSGYVWGVRVATRDPFLSIALFEVLHDAQYLAIVWAFNRRQVAMGDDRSTVSRALFGAGAARALAYVGVCLAYGATAWGTVWLVHGDGARKVLLAALATSAILHFYYDGFIWKLRQADTQRGLALGELGKRAGAATAKPLPAPRDRRALVHAAAFLVPLVTCALVEARARSAPTPARAIAAAIPTSAAAQRLLGDELLDAGDRTGAIAAYRTSLDLCAGYAEAHAGLARALLDGGQPDEASAHLDEALRLLPRLAAAHARRGDLLLARDQTRAAVDEYQQALALGDRDARTEHNLGNALFALHLVGDARAHLEEAARLQPQWPIVHLNLGRVLDATGRPAEAVRELEAALALHPGDAEIERDLGAELGKVGRLDEAAAHLERALAADPSSEVARQNLEALRRLQRR